MVGGRVVETIVCEEKVWVNCRDMDHGQECAIYLEKCPEALTISPGDNVWWQDPWAFWTPYEGTSLTSDDQVGPKDVKIPRASYSGVSKPSESRIVGRESDRT
jgi:hypothetical protein